MLSCLYIDPHIFHFQVLSVEARNLPAVGFKFSTQTILLIIGLVLGIYLIGYFLIVSIKNKGR